MAYPVAPRFRNDSDSDDTEATPLTIQATASSSHHPLTVTRLVKRISALITALLPIQVELTEITSPTSSILTSGVLDTFSKVGGDFDEVVPFALLEAHRYFRKEERRNPADAGENECRKIAAEALARKIVARLPLREQYAVLSARYTVVDRGEDETLATSALESAVDQRCTFFLSSSECQRVTFALWKGSLIQSQREDGSIVYEPHKFHKGGFLSHFNPSRLSVPRYQFLFRIGLWTLFILAYSQAVGTVDRSFGVEDWVLYIQLAGYVLEELVRIYKIRSIQAFTFFTLVNFVIFTLMGISLFYRVSDIYAQSDKQSAQYRMRSFQFLSCCAPLLYAKLLTVFDVFQYFGVCQIVLRRMLRESSIFFVLLSLLAAGFAQSLLGLDLADGSRDSTDKIINSLIQGLLGSPAFDLYERGTVSYPFGLIIYYTWSILTLILLLNILIALFGSAYADSVDSAVETFMAFFSAKTIESIRAPDVFVYVAPFNLIEAVIAPLEYCISRASYAKLNRVVMSVVFFLPLCTIALFETHFDSSRQKDYAALLVEPDEYSAEDRDPLPCYNDDEFGNGEDQGKVIARVSFEELEKSLPSLRKSATTLILDEVKALREEVAELRKQK